MMFGWIISLPDGHRLAHCSGPAYGPFGTSFCAEGYGFLSVSRFILRLHEFCGIEPSWRIQLMTGNLGLLTRIEKSLPHPEPFPNLTLASDWDVTHKIVTTLQAMKIKSVLEHVYGHQDNHKPYEDLPLNTQLSVDSDAKAGSYQQIHPAHRPIIPRLPHNRAQLHISGQVISSKLKWTIREAFTVSPYMAYLRTRHQWTPQCQDTINWTAYHQAIGRFLTKRNRITKLCNILLPTARWAN
jgi:hypothetical protein